MKLLIYFLVPGLTYSPPEYMVSVKDYGEKDITMYTSYKLEQTPRPDAPCTDAKRHRLNNKVEEAMVYGEGTLLLRRLMCVKWDKLRTTVIMRNKEKQQVDEKKMSSCGKKDMTFIRVMMY